MELTDLCYFHAVAAARSFVRGARAVHISPPAVSKAIRRIEDELGRPVLARTTRSVTLTDAGAALFARTERIFADLDALRDELGGGAPRGELRIAAMEVFSRQLLPHALAALVQEHPALVPSVHEMLPDRMARAIAQGRIDVGFTTGARSTPGVELVPLGSSRAVLVCGRTHPLHAAGRIRPRDLDRYPFVVPRFWEAEHLPPLDEFPDGRFRRRVGATIELLQMEVALVAAGAYLGFLPAVCVADELGRGELRELSGLRHAVRFALHALIPSGGPSAKVAALLARVRGQLSASRPVARAPR